MLKKYLLWYAQEHVSFRVPEFESLASLFQLKYSYLEKPSDKPYLVIECDSHDKLVQLMKRTVLARSLSELWCEADSYSQFYEKLKGNEITRKLSEHCEPESTFRILVESYGKKLSLKTKVEKIENIAFMPFEGTINLKHSDKTFGLYEYYGHDSLNIPDEPYKIMFALWIADSQRKAIADLTLKKRKFIANTSMDPQLSLIMANVAKIKTSDLILDPFVGSGSLLVSAAYYGGYVCGTDIDYKLLHGKTKPSRINTKKRDEDESVAANLRQYGLESKYIDIVVADASLPLWNEDRLLFNAIITDPPYGIREATERIGSDNKDHAKIPSHLLAEHIPSKVEYKLADIVRDLLEFSARQLQVGGRLVYWLPIDNAGQIFNGDAPTHQALTVLYVCKQHLSLAYSRLLIVMEKKCHVTHASNPSNTSNPSNKSFHLSNDNSNVNEQNVDLLQGNKREESAT